MDCHGNIPLPNRTKRAACIWWSQSPMLSRIQCQDADNAALNNIKNTVTGSSKILPETVTS